MIKAKPINAFVSADGAKCLYKPDSKSAIRVIPPYGSEVDIIEDAGDWVLIGFCGKEAWSPRQNLSPRIERRRPAVDVGVSPEAGWGVRSNGTGRNAVVQHVVEYGPRGGRFVRTASGFRRYF